MNYITGQLLLFTSGEYSDFEVHELLRVTKDFEPRAEVLAYLAEHPDQRHEYAGKETQFLAWLIRRGVVETVEQSQFHVASYGTFSEHTFGPLRGPEHKYQSGPPAAGAGAIGATGVAQ